MRGDFGVQENLSPVYMTGKFDAVIADTVQCTERKYLIAAAVGQNRTVPPHQPVQVAQRFDRLDARTHQQVIRVGQNNLRAGIVNLLRRQSLNRAARPDRHKRRRLHRAMRGGQASATGGDGSVLFEQFKSFHGAALVSIVTNRDAG